jgi:uncharacterized protein (TIGR02271 family)
MNPIGKVGAALTSDDTVAVPVIAESLQVGTREVVRGGVRVHRDVRDERVHIDPPLLKTHVDIERRVLNHLLEAGPAPEPHQDGDTLVIPVVEEVAVVQRRWLLKEELRITRSQHTIHRPQEVVLRRDHVTVERLSDAGDGEHDSQAHAHAGSSHPTHHKETP